jgi:hypothetical protein
MSMCLRGSLAGVDTALKEEDDAAELNIVSTVTSTNSSLSRLGGRAALFWLSLLYLLGLGVVAWLYFTDRLSLPGAVGSEPTAGILWFGALGGVLLSLSGVFDHPYDWDDAYRLWHIARPFVGAAVGLVAVLIVQAGILAVGQDPTQAPTRSESASKFILYYLVAFLVGYREETFRELIKRLADVILTPSPTAGGSAPTLTAVNPSEGSATGGESVTITGTGLVGTRVVKFGTTSGPRFAVTSDTELVAETPPGSANSQVQVTITTKAGPATGLTFRYT